MMADLKSCKVLVTPRSYGKNDPGLKSELEAAVGEVVYNPEGRSLKAEEVCKLIPGCAGYIAGLDEIDASVFEVAKDLKVISRYGVGVDRVDLETAKAKGVVVTNTPGANSVSVAELAVGLMLSLARNIAIADTAVKKGEWPKFSGTALEGKTVGIVGLGAIGRPVAVRLAAFDCKLVAHDPFADEKFAADNSIALLPVDELLGRADFVTLHCPVLDATRDMVNAEFLAKMKKGAFLVNTARGELVVEADLAAALESGQLRGAALDALRSEPPEAGNPLLGKDGVILTPHTGAHADSATNAMGRGALADCLAVLRGEKPRHPVT
ncbi:MAG: phosphoglycerate dehydrogenase [Planctomycetota bacterium]|jgi:phosphoglycerate dehydrogenase-like enzyme